MEQIERGKLWVKWGELPAAQTRADSDSAYGQLAEPQSPVVAALGGAGEAGSLARWWGWAAGRDECSSVVTGERVRTRPSEKNHGAERNQR